VTRTWLVKRGSLIGPRFASSGACTIPTLG
jgi:hypothetical protein